MYLWTFCSIIPVRHNYGFRLQVTGANFHGLHTYAQVSEYLRRKSYWFAYM